MSILVSSPQKKLHFCVTFDINTASYEKPLNVLNKNEKINERSNINTPIHFTNLLIEKIYISFVLNKPRKNITFSSTLYQTIAESMSRKKKVDFAYIQHVIFISYQVDSLHSYYLFFSFKRIKFHLVREMMILSPFLNNH